MTIKLKSATAGRSRLLATAAALSLPFAVGLPFVASSSTLAASGFVPLSAPERVLDTRSGESTSAGQMQGIGTVGAGSTRPIPIKGRVGITADATAVVLTVSATQPQGNGFATISPCGAARPTAS